ncbi:PD-(D/E)XK nuclease family protein (plasmid) [Xanthomonas citri pv. citri]|uniref:PD-(D/E)XK nuclease family protein n=1 Tax=Xanthomonas citri TaxID=346 RepID=UPI00193221C3|nr:PD-(D/E)XK nuclease family protein [Xanthomonas citri]QRD62750.1 PD-(D/E)XK nuclease family protein [Xanthomonas citri pv. citri]QRD67077.1 PD-(D/E)XK nuclease family protein [Xanthomonas citri pv. citri]QRD71670.1 PD-(D/E)XK nuclease family protein [Xanthomonas citri pv. citri]
MKPIYLSFSSDSTFQTCGWQYKLSRVDRISEIEESMATMFGKVVHTAIYLYLKSEIDGAQFTPSTFFEFEFKRRATEASLRLPAHWTMEDFIASGRLMMERFVEFWERGDYEVVRDAAGEPILEREFKIMLPDNIVYTAIIDAVLRRKRDGWIIVTDWKTPAQASFPEFALLSEQLTGYEVVVGAFLESLGLERIDGTMFVEMIKRKVPSKRGAMGPTVDEPTVVRMRTDEEKERWLEARLETARNIRAGKFLRRPLSAFSSPCGLCGLRPKCLHDSMEGLMVRPYSRRSS